MSVPAIGTEMAELWVEMVSVSQIVITDKKITHKKLKTLCEQWFGDMVKVVVDVKRNIVAIGGGLHADCEELLIQNGSQQRNVWGANFYPWHEPKDRIEFTALINIRPHQENPSMEILDQRVRKTVKKVVEKLILGPDEKLV